MLSSLVIPCLPNHEVFYTMMSSASVCIEAEWRLSVKDQHQCRHHDHHQHHQHHHHHRYCSVCFDVIFLLRSWLQRNWTTGLSLYGSRGSLFFFLRPASFLVVAVDPQYTITQFKQRHFIQISNILLQDSELSWINSVLRSSQSQSWRTSRAVGGRTVRWRLPEDEKRRIQ